MSQVRYQPLGPLLAGEGSRAFLGLALEEGKPPQPVVLVWAPPEVTRDSSLVAQLEQETRRATIFDHPNILRVHGLVSLDAGLARVTEYADGESLRRVLEVCKRLPPAFASLVVTDVAMGLHYGHLAGNDDGTPLVHGDLRPETVMVSFNGLVKVSGYGALAVAPREPGGRRVRNRRFYSAPEQLMGGREAISVRTDVFLLGLLLYECLSGRMPFQEEQDPDQALLNKQLPPLPGDVPAGFQQVIRRATAKRANERYATPVEFREALAAVIHDLPAYEQFAEYLQQHFPPSGEPRVTRQRMLEAAYAQPSAAPGSAPAAPLPRHNTFQLEVSVDEPQPAAPPPPPRHNTFQLEVSVDEAQQQQPPPQQQRPAPSNRKPPGRRTTLEASAVQMERAAAGAEERSSEEEDEEPSLPKRRSRVPLIAGGLLALVALGVGGFIALNGNPFAEPPPPVATAPAQPAADPQPADPKGTPTASATPEPVAANPPQPADAGTEPTADAGTAVAAAEPPKATTPEPSAPAKPPPPPEPPATATLVLTVQPPVRVSLGDKELGRTPLTVKLPPGRHSLQLSDSAKGVNTTYEVNLKDSAPNRVRVRLGKGKVVVRTPKGATILVNGKKMGRPPLARLSLYEGEHVVRVTKGAEQWEQSFRLQARKQLSFTAKLQAPASP